MKLPNRDAELNQGNRTAEDTGEAIRISGYSHNGEGVGRWQGKVIFIPGALRGELVSFKVTEEKKGYARGKLIRVLEPAQWRSPSLCPGVGACGSCQLQQMSYGEQLYFKEEQVRAALERIGGLKEIDVRPTLGMDNPWHYRHSARFHVRVKDGRIRIGYLHTHSHNLAELDRCPLLPEDFYPALEQIRLLLEPLGELEPIPVNQVVLRQGHRCGELLVVLICRQQPELDPVRVAAVAKTIPHCVGVVALIPSRRARENKARKRSALATSGHSPRAHRHDREITPDSIDPEQFSSNQAREIILYGRNYYQESVAGIDFRVPAQAFFQNNPEQAETLVRVVRQFSSSTSSLLDLYCGVGLFSLTLADQAKLVVGIEGNREAVAAARENAALNNLGNVTFSSGQVEKLLEELNFNPETLLLDPPRSGSTPEALDRITRLSPNQIIYISCNPSTLARDLQQLAENGYKVELAQPVDMFPQTYHVETVVLMSRL